MEIVFLLCVIVLVPGIAAGVTLGLSAKCVWQAIFGALGGAILGTIGGLFLGWELIPIKGGPHGNGLAELIGKSLIAAAGGSLLAAISGAMITVKLVRRAERRKAHRKQYPINRKTGAVGTNEVRREQLNSDPYAPPGRQ